MKYLVLIAIVFVALFTSCNNNNGDKKFVAVNADTLSKQRFLPVTTYFKGQLYSIKERGVNPIKYLTQNNKTDSGWVKIEELEKEVAEFLNPVIDSTNLNTLFVEKNFNDQSLNTITFTYDPVGKLPDSLTLKNWTVYVNPETGNIKSVYLVKTMGNKTTQLTWTNNSKCKMVYLTANADGSFVVDKEVKIVWDF